MFVLHRMGREAGNTLEEIFDSKERMRENTGGFFTWGIGEDISWRLSALPAASRIVYFTQMASKEQPIDSSPDGVVTWTKRADGSEIPSILQVTSRQHTSSGRLKVRHFALYCQSDDPLLITNDLGMLYLGQLRNFASGRPLGPQTTATVSVQSELEPGTTVYRIRAVARIVDFVRLACPTRVAHR